MSKFLVTKKQLEDVTESSKPKLLVSNRHTEISDSDLPQFSTIKKHIETKVTVSFDSQGGSSAESNEYILGQTYSELPTSTKSQHIFTGWFTDPENGVQITEDSIVSLDVATLYAHWEYVEINVDNCTSYTVTTTSSYKNTGIYTASISNSANPIYIDWGDGSVEKTYSSISQKSHTYSNVGTFTVKISDNIASFAPSYNNSTWYNTTSTNRYTFKGMISTGSKVATLPTYAFYYCAAMTNIDFMETCWTSVTSIPNYCFYYCSGLTDIQGAKRFTSLGSNAFRYCTGLSGVQDLSEFKFTNLNNTGIFMYCSNVLKWILPNGFTGTRFGTYTFNGNSKLSVIELPSSLTALGDYVFQECTSLTRIVIPQNVQLINNYAFNKCYALSTVNIETTNLTAINQYAFYNCNKLTDLDLPDAVKTIGNYAFYGCTSLDYVGRMANDLPYDAEIEYLESTGTQYIDSEINTISSIGFRVVGKILDEHIADTYPAIVGSLISDWSSYFEVYKNLNIIWCDSYNINEIYTIQTTPSDIKFDAEMNYYNSGDMHITDIETNTKKTSKCITPNINVSLGCFCAITENGPTDFSKSKIYTVQITNNKTLVRDFIPVRVGNVGYMYDKVSGQLFGNSGTGNFILGPDVKTKELPSQLTSIGSYAYQGCGNLKSLNIPENLQTIGDYAFAGCYQISSIIDKRLTAQTVSTNTFGSATSASNTAFTGYQTKGNNILLTYFAATDYDESYWQDPLQNPDKCGFNLTYLDPENIKYCTITFDANGGAIVETEITAQAYQTKNIKSLPKPYQAPDGYPYFTGWNTAQDGSGTTITAGSTIPSQDTLTLYAQYSTTPPYTYTVDLNDQWRVSTTQTNPDENAYNGVYESYSNYNVSSGWAKMKINITGYTNFVIYIRSYGESSYDYTLAFNLDVEPTSNPSSSSSGVKAHTSGKQQSGTAISNYTKVEYTEIDGGEHFICVVYRKDSSVNSGNDRGYLLIEKSADEPLPVNPGEYDPDPNYTQHLCFTAEEDGSTISMIKGESAPEVSLRTTVDGQYWKSFIPGETVINLAQVGDKIYFKASEGGNNRFCSTSGTSVSYANYFSMTGKIAASGNIMSLLNGEEQITELTEEDNSRCFTRLFYNCTSLTTAPALPAETLANYCYSNMFQGCTSLTSAPALPAETLANYCYSNMFRDCTSLTIAPALTATTLADRCYNYMFYGCTSLTSAPELKAETLANYCCYRMFSGCKALTTVAELPATVLTDNCYSFMFFGCTSLTSAPELSAETLVNQCYFHMFQGCTSLTSAPELKAETLVTQCYSYMFHGCTNLNSLSVNFSAWNPTNATTNWLYNILSSGTFTCPAELPETRGTSYIPTNWTIERTPST